MHAAVRRTLAAAAVVAAALLPSARAQAQANFSNTTIIGTGSDVAHTAQLQFDVTQAGTFSLFTRGPQIDANMYVFAGSIASLGSAPLFAGRFDDECPDALCGPAGGARNSLAQLFLNLGTYTLVGGSHYLSEDEARTGNAEVYIYAASETTPLSLVVTSQDGMATPFNASSTVPEPGTWALMGTGLVGLVGVARRRRSA